MCNSASSLMFLLPSISKLIACEQVVQVTVAAAVGCGILLPAIPEQVTEVVLPYRMWRTSSSLRRTAQSPFPPATQHSLWMTLTQCCMCWAMQLGLASWRLSPAMTMHAAISVSSRQASMPLDPVHCTTVPNRKEQFNP